MSILIKSAKIVDAMSKFNGKTQDILIDKGKIQEISTKISDSKVKSILINVFGGIVRCDVVAEGIISAIKDVGIKIPVVVRLKGNNSEIAKSLLEKSKLNIFTELDLSKAAKKAVELSE